VGTPANAQEFAQERSQDRPWDPLAAEDFISGRLALFRRPKSISHDDKSPDSGGIPSIARPSLAGRGGSIDLAYRTRSDKNAAALGLAQGRSLDGWKTA